MSWIRWETFGADYLLLVFMLSLGVLQLVASYRRLRGLSFFRISFLGYAFATLVIIGGYFLFFSEPRNIPDYDGGLGGSQLFIYTIVGIAAAGIVTLIVSSVINAWWRDQHPGDERGLDVLRKMTYLQAIKRGFKQRTNDRTG